MQFDTFKRSLKKFKTAVLVDRNHKIPVKADLKEYRCQHLLEHVSSFDENKTATLIC
jgi:hypothetical protein